MAEEVALLSPEEVAAVRSCGVAWCGEEMFERLCATVEALQAENARLRAERDNWQAEAIKWQDAYENDAT